MDATGLPPGQLQLEITEQAVLERRGRGAGRAVRPARAGVRLALDDFGTGYSSLAWLRRLPVHALKIDGSFIDGLRHPAADPVDRSIVEALIRMAHALGLEVTAEWVETAVSRRSDCGARLRPRARPLVRSTPVPPRGWRTSGGVASRERGADRAVCRSQESVR